MAKKLFTSKGKDVDLGDVFKKIWEDNEANQGKLVETSTMIERFVGTIQDVVLLMPSILELQSLSVKNSDLLIRLAAIAQKMEEKVKETGPVKTDEMTPDLRAEMLKIAREISTNNRKPNAAALSDE